MNILYYNLIISFLSLFSFSFFDSQKPLSSNSTLQNDIVGTWTYTLLVCGNGERKEAEFEIQIEKDCLINHGNLLECNSCTAPCVVGDNKIKFSGENTIVTCTTQVCYSPYKFCGKKNVLTNLYQDMNYTINDDELILEARGKTLKLKRKK